MLETTDQYDVIKATGEGAFGKAYLAEGKSECEPCVTKEIDFAKVKKFTFLLIFSGVISWLFIQ